MRININDVQSFKLQSQKFSMLTAYDYSTARILDEAGIPLILVGDSLGMVILGYESTIPVTMEDMLHHTRAVVRGACKAMVIADMPFMSYHISADQALSNAARFIQEAGAQAVKLEGGKVVSDKIRRITGAGIPVMGHLGLTPQYVHQLGGYRVQAKDVSSAVNLFNQALAVEAAGAFALVLETVPVSVAEYISRHLTIPTIGIGAGPGCDGQVQVINDLLGSFSDFSPRHARKYVDLSDIVSRAVSQYKDDVEHGSFPGPENSFKLDGTIFEQFIREVE